MRGAARWGPSEFPAGSWGVIGPAPAQAGEGARARRAWGERAVRPATLLASRQGRRAGAARPRAGLPRKAAASAAVASCRTVTPARREARVVARSAVAEEEEVGGGCCWLWAASSRSSSTPAPCRAPVCSCRATAHGNRVERRAEGPLLVRRGGRGGGGAAGGDHLGLAAGFGRGRRRGSFPRRGLARLARRAGARPSLAVLATAKASLGFGTRGPRR